MRKIVYSMIVSLDGYIAGPNQDIRWTMVDEELHTHFNQQESSASVQLYGRRLYEVMRYWETADKNPDSSPVELEYARIWQSIPKVVFSRTLAEVGPNARLVRDNVAKEVAALKAQPGQPMFVGGAGLAAAFMRLGLIDEYQLYVQPVVLGGGTSFFPPSETKVNLKLLDTRTFSNGTVMLHYRSAE
jgi:dihydrofolate reductase